MSAEPTESCPGCGVWVPGPEITSPAAEEMRRTHDACIEGTKVIPIPKPKPKPEPEEVPLAPAAFDPSPFLALLDALGHPGPVSICGHNARDEFATLHVVPRAAVADLDIDPTRNTWFGINPVGAKVRPPRRGSADEVPLLLCVWLDIDVFLPELKGRKGAKWVPTREAAWGLVAALEGVLGVRATVVVNSGHGLQVYWTLSEPIVITDDNRDEVKAMLTRWHRLASRVAGAEVGGEVDSTADLARVFRVPGTMNTKTYTVEGVEMTLPPVPVVLESSASTVIDVDTLVEALDAYEEEPEAPREEWTGQEATEDEVSRTRALMGRVVGRLASEEPGEGGEGGGRNRALNVAAVILGHYVPHLLSAEEVTAALLGACEANGLLKDDKKSQCLKTIRSGLAKGMSEPQEAPPEDDEYEVPAWDWREDGAPPELAGGMLLDRDTLDDLPCSEPFIRGVFSRPAAVVLVGAYGSYKSFLALSWALASATGGKWMGRETHATKVLLVVGEGAHGLAERVRAWEVGYNGGQRVPADRFAVLVQPRSFSEAKTWAEVAAYAVAGGYGLVILDTLSSLAADADETKDSAQIMRWLGMLASRIAGAAVLVHHPGHGDKGRTRGGYQFEANADEVLVMASEDGSDLATLTGKKVKDGPAGWVIWLKAAPVEGSLVLGEVRAADVAAPMRERLLTVLLSVAGEGITTRQARIAVGQDPESTTGRSTFFDAAGHLRGEGLLITRGAGASTRHYHRDHAPEASA